MSERISADTAREILHMFFGGEWDYTNENIGSDGYALQYASDRLKNDRDVVLAAAKCSGSVLEYAGDDFKDDREIVLASLENGRCTGIQRYISKAKK